MEKTTSKNLYIFLIVFLLITTTIGPASAMTVSFVDNAYLKSNDYVISDQSGTAVANFTGSSTVTLVDGRSYSVGFKPNGLFDLSKESPGDFTSLGTTLNFFHQNLAGLIVIGAIIGYVSTRRG